MNTQAPDRPSPLFYIALLIALVGFLLMFVKPSRGEDLPAALRPAAAKAPAPGLEGVVLPDAPIAKAQNAWTKPPKPLTNDHVFWDRRKKMEFAAMVALQTFDEAQTCHFLANGRHEQNLTQSCPGNIAITAGIAAGAVGLSYFLHRSKLHRLEGLPYFFSISQSLDGIIVSKKRGAW